MEELRTHTQEQRSVFRRVFLKNYINEHYSVSEGAVTESKLSISANTSDKNMGFSVEDPEEAEEYNENSGLLNLPELVVEKIIGYMSYDEIAQKRIVCRRFNQVNKRLLNKGFRRVERYQAKFLKEVKGQLPRRESERRNHPLFRHCDILTAIETRLSLLNMTFTKYVDCSMCCFIPGKVIDEIYRVLKFISSNRTLPRSHELLTELRDISSMAMEHFEEKIVHLLKPNPSMTPTTPRFSLATAPFSSPLSSIATPGTSRTISSSKNMSPPTPGSPDQISELMTATKNNRNLITTLKKDCHELRSKQTELKRKVSEQERVVLEQSRIISEQSSKLTSQENKMNEINRKFLEYDQRFGDLMAELAHHSREDGANSTGTSGASGSSLLRYHSVQQPVFVANMVPVPVPTYMSAATHSYTASPLAFSVSSTVAGTAMPQPQHGSSSAGPQASTSVIKESKKEKEAHIENRTDNLCDNHHGNNRSEGRKEIINKNKKDLHKRHKRHHDDHNMDSRPNKIRKK